MTEASILAEQMAYYRARAPEYDAWFFREGRYDRGPEHRELWFGEVREVGDALNAERPSGDILELACGTGIWTRRLAAGATTLTAVDASPEAIAINRARLGASVVTYEVADIFQWTPEATYDFVFFGFWLSHVPPDLMDSFWKTVRSCLRPHGKVFLVDSLDAPEVTSREERVEHTGTVVRQLGDGRTFRIVKQFYRPADLSGCLDSLGWVADLRRTEHFFIYGTAR